MQVIIGIDPHKATHTAVAVNGDEDELARLKLRASRGQVDKLLMWAAPFPSRRWAIEGAEGLGFLLAQQLVTAGETVVDVPATLAARTRVLGTGRSNKHFITAGLLADLSDKLRPSTATPPRSLA